MGHKAPCTSKVKKGFSIRDELNEALDLQGDICSWQLLHTSHWLGPSCLLRKMCLPFKSPDLDWTVTIRKKVLMDLQEEQLCPEGGCRAQVPSVCSFLILLLPL